LKHSSPQSSSEKWESESSVYLKDFIYNNIYLKGKRICYILQELNNINADSINETQGGSI
jgi:hypothetical protein